MNLNVGDSSPEWAMRRAQHLYIQGVRHSVTSFRTASNFINIIPVPSGQYGTVLSTLHYPHHTRSLAPLWEPEQQIPISNHGRMP